MVYKVRLVYSLVVGFISVTIRCEAFLRFTSYTSYDRYELSQPLLF